MGTLSFAPSSFPYISSAFWHRDGFGDCASGAGRVFCYYMKKAIIVLSIFVLGFFVGYATNTLTSLYRAFSSSYVSLSPSKDSAVGVRDANAPERGGEQSPQEGDTSAAPSKPITIPVTALTDGQKALLGKLGIDPTTFVVTPGMVTCAEDTLGTARVTEIIAGGTPSALETLRLSSCLNK